MRAILDHGFAVLFDGEFEGIPAIGGSENRPAARENSADGFERELVGLFGPDEPVEAVRDADDAPAVFQLAVRTTARMTALSPGQSPPPLQTPMVRIAEDIGVNAP